MWLRNKSASVAVNGSISRVGVRCKVRPGRRGGCRAIASDGGSIANYTSVGKAGAGVRVASPKGKTSPAPKPLPFQGSKSRSRATENRDNGSSTSRSSQEARPVSELIRSRWIALFGTGAATLCISFFIAAQAVNWYRTPVAGHETDVPTGRPQLQSPLDFDKHLDKSEWRLGITKLRRRLGAMASGHVLEVAMGTGRNLEFYQWELITNPDGSSPDNTLGLKSFTGLDISKEMLDVALIRMHQVVPDMDGVIPAKSPSFSQLAAAQSGSPHNGQDAQGKKALSLLAGKVRMLQSDAQSHLPPVPPAATEGTHKAGYYDTIVQSFGLCSVRDPVTLLANMAASVRPGTGRIILLEHGRSWWELVNGLLDRTARGHFDNFGCWWNRDIELIVHEARRRVPGLEIVALERPGWGSFGTHLWIELRVDTAKPEGEAKLLVKG